MSLKKAMNIIIIGNSGSGKTFLAKQLGDKFKTKVFHLDEFCWEPGGFSQKRSPEEVQSLIETSKRMPYWIVEGVYGDLAEQYFDKANTLIWIDINWQVCQQRLESRTSNLGRPQTEDGSRQLLAWAYGYYEREDFNSYKGHKSLFERFSGQKHCLQSENQVNEFLMLTC